MGSFSFLSRLSRPRARPDLISIQNRLALAWCADVKFMVVFLNGSGPRHIYFRWRSTFLPSESEITQLAVISHSIYRRSRREIFPRKRTRFQASGPSARSQPRLLSRRTDRQPIVSYSRPNGKSLLRNCCGHCVFFYITFYDGRWLFFNYQSTEELWKVPQRGRASK